MLPKNQLKYLESLLFPVKLYKLADHPDIESVRWSCNGNAVTIDTDRLAKECFCPEIFNVADHKHVFRQLSYYGFKRVQRVGNVWEFHHPHFLAPRLDLVKNIRRAGKKNRNFIKAEDIKPDFFYIERRKSSRLKNKDSFNYFLDPTDVKDESFFDPTDVKDEPFFDPLNVSPEIGSKPNTSRGRKRKQPISDEENTEKPRVSKTQKLTYTNFSSHSTSGKDLSLLKTTVQDKEPSPPIIKQRRSKPRRQRRKRRAKNVKKSVCKAAGKPSYDVTLVMKDHDMESERTVVNDYVGHNNQFHFHDDINLHGFQNSVVKTEQQSSDMDNPVSISNLATYCNMLDCEITYVSEALNPRQVVTDTTRDESLRKVVLPVNTQNDHNYSIVDCDTLSDSVHRKQFSPESMPTDKNTANDNILTPVTEIKSDKLSKSIKNCALFVLGSNYSWKHVEEIKNQNKSDSSKVLEDLLTINEGENQLSNESSKTCNKTKDLESSRPKSNAKPFSNINDVFRTCIKVEPVQSSQTMTSQNSNISNCLPDFQNLCKPADVEADSTKLSVEHLNKITDVEKPPIKIEDAHDSKSDIVKLETNVEKQSSAHHKEIWLSKNHNINDILISPTNNFIGGYCLRDRTKVKKEDDNINQSQFDRNSGQKRPRHANFRTRSKSHRSLKPYTIIPVSNDVDLAPNFNTMSKSHTRGSNPCTIIPVVNQDDLAPNVKTVSNGTFQFIKPNQISIANSRKVMETSKTVIKRSTENETCRTKGDNCSLIYNIEANHINGVRRKIPKETCRANGDNSSLINHTEAYHINGVIRQTSKETRRANGDSCSFNNTEAYHFNGIRRKMSKETYQSNKINCPITMPIVVNQGNDMRRHTPKDTSQANNDNLSYTNHTATSRGMNRHTLKETCQANNHTATNHGMNQQRPNGTYRANGSIRLHTNHTAESIEKDTKTQSLPIDNPLTFLTLEEALCSLHLPRENLNLNQPPTGDVSCLTLLYPEKLKQPDDVYIPPTKRKQLVKSLHDKFMKGEVCSWDIFESPNPYIRSCAYDAFTLDYESA